jgi:GNAT superfamily N-acetyltransferase
MNASVRTHKEDEPSARPPRLVIADATEADAEPLAAFFRAVWHADDSADSVRAWMRRSAVGNVAEPGRFPPTIVARADSRVIGYCSSLPLRIWDGHTERPAYWAKGLMVVPEHRNGPIGFHVLRALAQRLPLSAAVTVHPASKRLFGAAGYQDLGPVPNFVCPIAPGRILGEVDLTQLPLDGWPGWIRRAAELVQRSGAARAIGAPATLVMRAAFLRRPSPPGLLVTETDPPHEGALDRLWQRVRGGIAFGPVRDGRAILGRYAVAPPGRRYRFVTAMEAGELVGLCMVRPPGASPDPRLGGTRVAAIADLVFPPDRPDIGAATLRAGARLAAALGADAALLSASHAAVARIARTAGFFAVPGNIHFFLRAGATPAEAWSSSLGDWWLSRGDGESDAAF